MTKRLEYIDSLKGFAILLMVMGHVMAWFWADWQDALKEDSRVMLLWRIIYSFHMPLFMFCSGLLIPKEFEWFNVNNVVNTVKKRLKSLMLPYFFMGSVYYLVTGEILSYWFLWSLFVFCIFVLFVQYFISIISVGGGKYIESTVYIIISLVLFKHSDRLWHYHCMPFIDMDHIRLFPYFCLGIITTRFSLLSWASKNNIIFTLSLLGFCGLTWYCTILQRQFPMWWLTCSLLPTAGIAASLLYFAHYADNNSKVCNILQNFGRHSLEIYLLHTFFKTKFPEIGAYCVHYAETFNDGRGIIAIQFVLSFVLSITIIWLCYIVIEVISKSSILSMCLLGRKYN